MQCPIKPLNPKALSPKTLQGGLVWKILTKELALIDYAWAPHSEGVDNPDNQSRV